MRVLTTDAEFHSFTRQIPAMEEDGLAIVDRIPAEPFETFPERSRGGKRRRPRPDLSEPGVLRLRVRGARPRADRVRGAGEPALVVVDGYHAFMALPDEPGASRTARSSSPAATSTRCPARGPASCTARPATAARPLDTGWYAGFGQLETGCQPDDRLRRRWPVRRRHLRPVRCLSNEGGPRLAEPRSLPVRHPHMSSGSRTVSRRRALPVSWSPPLPREETSSPFDDTSRGHLQPLHDREVITDYRGDRLRIGFGIYQDEADVDRLIGALASLRPLGHRPTRPSLRGRRAR